jgi:DNA-binding SARP family transcriptional activator
MDLRVLGNVEIHHDGEPITLRRAGERCVLATLALSPGRRVHLDTLIDHVWGDDPPTNAEHTIASYIRAARRAIEQAGGHRDWLRNHRPGAYQLDLAPTLVDYHRFTALVTEARRKQRTGHPTDAIDAYHQAVSLRRAEALANLTGQWAEHRRYAIEQEYLDTVCALYEQQLAAGDFAAVTTSATHLVTEVTPTDRMILLALHGLAGSSQHAAIHDFLTRATQRMWDTAQAKPGPQVRTTAHELVTRPTARLVAPQPPTTAAPTADPAPDTRMPATTVTMSASHNGSVFQAAGDQYIAKG